MLPYTAPERGILVTIYLTNNRSVTLAQREFRRRFPGRPTPTGETLRRLAACLEETGTTRDAARRGRPRSSHSAENIAAVAEDVMEAPSTSTRRRATQMGISRRSLQRILVQDLKMFPSKVQSSKDKKAAAYDNGTASKDEDNDEDNIDAVRVNKGHAKGTKRPADNQYQLRKKIRGL